MKLLLLSIVVLINQSISQTNDSQRKNNHLYPSPNLEIRYQQEWQKIPFNNRVNDFRNNPIGNNKIVFLGNSIIEAGNNWNEKFGVDNIINRGISGDFTEGVLSRLNEIIYYKPIAVFILIGINDIFDDHANRKDITTQYVASNIMRIANQVKMNSNETKIFIQTILPVDTVRFMDFHDRKLPVYKISLNDQINKINLLIKDNKDHTIIDLHSLFIDKRGLMNKQFTTDGVHLNNAGYSFWVENIRKDILSCMKE